MMGSDRQWTPPYFFLLIKGFESKLISVKSNETNNKAWISLPKHFREQWNHCYTGMDKYVNGAAHATLSQFP